MRQIPLLLALLAFAGCDGTTDSCIARGTPIATPEGPVAVEELAVGDAVYSFDARAGRVVPARITAIRKAVRPCIRLEAPSGRWIRATRDHPFLTADGSYRPAASVSSVRTADELLPVRRLAERGLHDVYDLTVDGPHHNFIAAGFVVHNKSFVPRVDAVILSVEHAASGTRAEVRDELDGGIDSWTTSAVVDSVSGDEVFVTVTSGSAMDAIYVAAQPSFVQGAWRLAIDPPADTVQLRIVTSAADLVVYGVVGSSVAQPEFVLIR
ncbi:MAG: Hint domain-containing protein [Planctomycetota bacterium]